jgi:hypothetical protein
MPLTPNLPVGVEPVGDEMRVGGAGVIDDAWKDDIVNRLLLELKRQLCQLENTKPTTEIDQANIRIVNVRACRDGAHAQPIDSARRTARPETRNQGGGEE